MAPNNNNKKNSSAKTWFQHFHADNTPHIVVCIRFCVVGQRLRHLNGSTKWQQQQKHFVSMQSRSLFPAFFSSYLMRTYGAIGWAHFCQFLLNVQNFIFDVHFVWFVLRSTYISLFAAILNHTWRTESTFKLFNFVSRADKNGSSTKWMK